MAELKDLKTKSKHKHQQLVEIEYLVDVKKHVKKGEKTFVGHKAAAELVEAKRAKLVKA